MVSATVSENTTETFRNLRGATQRTILRAGANAAGRVQVKAVKARVPRKSRLLASTIASVTRTKNGRVVVVIGQAKAKSFGDRARKIKDRGAAGGLSGQGELVRMHLVDQPVRTHEIAGPVRTPFGVFARVQHPGHPGRHFLLGAAIASESSAIEAFGQKVRERTEATQAAAASAGGDA